MNTVFLLLGSNLGNRIQNLTMCKELLYNKLCIPIKESQVYETEPWGWKNQDFFLNQIIQIKTGLSPSILLDSLMNIERTIGRIRSERWKSRIIDIDILYFNDFIIKIPALEIPHPMITMRRFTLVPLSEIAPNFEHPILKFSSKTLLESCKDLSSVKMLN